MTFTAEFVGIGVTCFAQTVILTRLTMTRFLGFAVLSGEIFGTEAHVSAQVQLVFTFSLVFTRVTRTRYFCLAVLARKLLFGDCQKILMKIHAMDLWSHLVNLPKLSQRVANSGAQNCTL